MTTDTFPYNVRLPTAEERQRREHAIEWSYQWQYAVTHRTLRGLNPDDRLPGIAPLHVPPDDRPGWEINVDYADKGHHYRPPSWCKDGTALMQSVHWRRRDPSIGWTSPNRMIHIDRTEP